MSQQLITTSNADRNLAAGATVLSATPDASNPRLCYALVLLGDGTKNLDGTGGDFAVTVTIAGNSWLGGNETYTLGTAARAAMQTEAFFVPAGAVVTIVITSPNAADTDVDCTAYLVSENGASQSSVTSVSDEVNKIPRAALALTAGAAVTRTNTSETPNQTITETLS